MLPFVPDTKCTFLYYLVVPCYRQMAPHVPLSQHRSQRDSKGRPEGYIDSYTFNELVIYAAGNLSKCLKCQFISCCCARYNYDTSNINLVYKYNKFMVRHDGIKSTTNY